MALTGAARRLGVAALTRRPPLQAEETTLKAGDLREKYLARLADRKARLDHLSRLTGWHYLCHHTNDSAQNALLWIWRAMDGGHG